MPDTLIPVDGVDDAEAELAAAIVSASGGSMFQRACGKLQQELHRRLEETRHRYDRRGPAIGAKEEGGQRWKPLKHLLQEKQGSKGPEEARRVGMEGILWMAFAFILNHHYLA